MAVIGGGNSGVEAAIDLAGIVEHVTLLEFADTLRADQVLQDKLASLPNTTVIKSALTTEVVGDGSQVTALRYQDRVSGEDREIELAGIFVQIGLLPNTDFLKGSEVELSNRGEIVVNERNETNVKVYLRRVIVQRYRTSRSSLLQVKVQKRRSLLLITLSAPVSNQIN